jgi:enoyl-CoA hydratase/carnithine racemase
MPWPIRPPPATPIFSISIRLDVMGLVEIEDRGAVRHIVLNRAEKRNAFNGELIEAAGRAFEDAAADDSVRVVVVRGNGPMFSSGMDLGSLQDLSTSPGSLRDFRTPILAWWNLLEEMPKPTIVQIHGACIGGAMELALAADMRVMAEDAVAAILEVKIGLIPDVGGCSRLPAVVGVGRAKELIMTGRFLGAEEALQIGFANRIAPADELDATTQALCDELLAAAPIAVALAKRVIDQAAKPALEETLEREVEAQEQLAASDDFAEGTSAFLGKRAPEFAGR